MSQSLRLLGVNLAFPLAAVGSPRWSQVQGCLFRAVKQSEQATTYPLQSLRQAHPPWLTQTLLTFGLHTSVVSTCPQMGRLARGSCDRALVWPGADAGSGYIKHLVVLAAQAQEWGTCPQAQTQECRTYTPHGGGLRGHYVSELGAGVGA